MESLEVNIIQRPHKIPSNPRYHWTATNQYLDPSDHKRSAPYSYYSSGKKIYGIEPQGEQSKDYLDTATSMKSHGKYQSFQDQQTNEKYLQAAITKTTTKDLTSLRRLDLDYNLREMVSWH